MVTLREEGIDEPFLSGCRVARAVGFVEKLDVLQTAVDEQPRAEIEIQVVDSLRHTKGDRCLIVLLKENGLAVNADIVSIEAVVDKGPAVELAPVGFEVTEIAEGLVEVRLDLERSLNSAKMFLIRAEREFDDGEDIMYGAELYISQQGSCCH